MRGCLRKGDIVFLRETTIQELSKGDVIVFRDNHDVFSESLIVHRIIDKRKDLLITKGDNNKTVDQYPITQKDIVGKVISLHREGRNRKISGGYFGLIIAKSKYFLRRIRSMIYKRITRIPMIRQIGKSVLNVYSKDIKKINLKSKDGIIIKWVHNKKVIARKDPDSSFVSIKKPFDLIIEKKNKKVKNNKEKAK